MIINVHAGHNPAGRVACGAVGLIDESKENRIVKDNVIKMLRLQGHTIYDCTVNDGISQNDVLNKIVRNCNSHNVDLDVSIHFNSGANDLDGNGTTCGTEVWVYPNGGTREYANNICSSIAALGFRNRGVKETKYLYVLNKTLSPALLIECCFVDDRDDTQLYSAEKMAAAIVNGITGVTGTLETATPEQYKAKSTLYYRVHVEGIGWDAVRNNGEIAGTVGQSRRVEALKIDWPNHDIYAKAHLQGKGWVDFGKITRDTVIGTTSQSKRLECLCLKGNFKYRVHIQNFGWSAWTKADGVSTLGTVGQALRIEAIQIEEM